jgi:cob(I)alamin adenosyltransferase
MHARTNSTQIHIQEQYIEWKNVSLLQISEFWFEKNTLAAADVEVARRYARMATSKLQLEGWR